MEFEENTGLTNELNPDNNKRENAKKKELPRGPEPEDTEEDESNEDSTIDFEMNEARQSLNETEIADLWNKEDGARKDTIKTLMVNRIKKTENKDKDFGN